MSDDTNRRRHERFPLSKSVETTSLDGTQSGELTDISAGGAAIAGQAPLLIGVGEPVELRVENYEPMLGHVVRASGGNSFAIAFDLGTEEARHLVDEIAAPVQETE